LKTSDGLVTLASTITDANGYYEFLLVAPGDYMLDASTTKPWGGVNINDAIILANNLVSFVPGTLLFKAADVNQSGVVNINDAIIIANSIPPNTKVSAWTAPDWIFQKEIFNLSITDVYIDVLGVCSGDVNASYNPLP